MPCDNNIVFFPHFADITRYRNLFRGGIEIPRTYKHKQMPERFNSSSKKLLNIHNSKIITQYNNEYIIIIILASAE